ncbi:MULTISPECIES: AAA family ATPase [Streptomyces]
MYSLGMSGAAQNDFAPPLPPVWETFKDNGVRFRRGEFTLISAAPGVGKSALALYYAIKSGLKVMYFSADSGSRIQRARAAAIVSGEPLSKWLDLIERGDTADMDRMLTEACPNVFFDYDAGPDLAYVEDTVKAFALVHGAWPDIVVIDNVSNLYAGDAEGFAGLEDACAYINELARQIDGLVLGLHHVVGEFESGDKPPPLSALRGKISKLPSLILNLFKEDEDSMGVAVVKNRSGRANAAGGHTVTLACDLSTMQITDPVHLAGPTNYAQFHSQLNEPVTEWMDQRRREELEHA